MTEAFAELFNPVSIGRMRLKNRVVLSPTSFRGFDVSYDPGTQPGFGPARLETYAVQARGGVGLIIMEDSEVDGTHGAVARHDVTGPQHPAFDRDLFIPALAELVNTVHAFGAKIVPNLRHLGRSSLPVDGSSPLSASSGPNTHPTSFVQSKPIPAAPAREANLEEIAELQDKFVMAAFRAKRARFDGVLIGGHHGMLISQFLSPMTNKRTDKYGGSLGNRMRFALEIVEKTRARVGNDFPILFGMAGDELTEGGTGIEESKVIAREMERAGVDALFIAPGIIFPFPGKYKVLPPMGTPDACYADIAHAIKKEVKIPVIANGNLKNPAVANKVLKDGKADLVALGRALIADPNWPIKVKQGKVEEITPCIMCTYCSETMQARHPARCTVNFDWGRIPQPVAPAPVKKKVVVVGGGPAGMEAARVAALRGHEVHLLEGWDRLGGQLNLAYVPPGKYDIRPYVEYMVRQINKVGVKVHLKTQATVPLIKSFQPDVVILATGARVQVPWQKQDETKSNGHSVTAWDVLSGKAKVGDRVVVVGGGATGCETSEYLLERGKNVTIIEMQDELAPDMVLIGAGMRFHMLTRLTKSTARILTGTTVVEVGESGVTVKNKSGQTQTIPADTVVSAAGVKSQVLDPGDLELSAEVHTIGDCVRPRNMLDAIWEGSRLARAI